MSVEPQEHGLGYYLTVHGLPVGSGAGNPSTSDEDLDPSDVTLEGTCQCDLQQLISGGGHDHDCPEKGQ